MDYIILVVLKVQQLSIAPCAQANYCYPTHFNPSTNQYKNALSQGQGDL